MDEVVIPPSTKFSGRYLDSYKTYHPHTLSIQHTSPVRSIQPTLPREQYTGTLHFSSPPSLSPLRYVPSFTILSNQGPAERRNKQRFAAPLVVTLPISKPAPYKEGLVPIASVLRPHCLARDRLKLWRPVESRSLRNANGKILAVTDEDLQRVLTVMNSAWTQSTRESYGAGLLVFHVFCDTRGVPELQRCPVDTLMILAFVAGCAGAYAGRTLANYVFAIRAWHVLHGQTWEIQQNQLKSALDGAASQAPPDSKRAKREPFTMSYITQIKTHLNLNSPLDAAVFTCLTSTFYSLARLGELTVRSIKGFMPEEHVKPSDVRMNCEDRNRFQVSRIHLPCTKTSAVREDIYWSRQSDTTDPEAALAQHFMINEPSPNDHLFSWKHPKGARPLTRGAFLKRIASIAKAGGCPDLKGHGIRIGGTLEYLLRGIPFDVVKSMGRWSSEAFTIYLRDHAIIMAPYLQDTPIVEPFTRYTMPLIR
ncbi:hypothetical protein DEU56DRAFT_739759 [Suillus clintonianus]|uniref:uncharacterized protein n=1 Tax=Suillus clintonianus TaxID=1904413 RepID=UPI001B861A4D|nr:uncharacterized protein DEU56DRAFT_739759 [Suillus clintonianus]KAG2132039.1 hypothetical protein DEU56DRAFT_739759 [Suillus clintonianus]